MSRSALMLFARNMAVLPIILCVRVPLALLWWVLRYAADVIERVVEGYLPGWRR